MTNQQWPTIIKYNTQQNDHLTVSVKKTNQRFLGQPSTFRNLNQRETIEQELCSGN